MADASERVGQAVLRVLHVAAAPAPAQPLLLHGRPALPHLRLPWSRQARLPEPQLDHPDAQPSPVQLKLPLPAAATSHEVLPLLPPANPPERSNLSPLQGKVEVFSISPHSFFFPFLEHFPFEVFEVSFDPRVSLEEPDGIIWQIKSDFAGVT